MFVFALPWLFLLLPLPWVISRWFPSRSIAPIGVRVPFGKRIAASTGTKSDSRSPRDLAAFITGIIIWSLLLAALARPQWQVSVSKNQPTRDLLLLVDLSGSMQAEDFTNAAGETVDRLTAIKEVLGEFLLQRSGDRVGLVVFGDAAFLQTPFTADLELCRQLLDETEIGMAGPRTALGDAIGLGIELFEKSDAPAKTMIALTDGNDTKSNVPPPEAARIAAERKIRIHTVAIGDPATLGEEKLDEESLQDVAHTSGGAYFFAADRQQLNGIYQELDKIETREVNTLVQQVRFDLYYWPLLAALIAALIGKLVVVLRQLAVKEVLAPSTSVRVDPASGKLEIMS